MNFSSIHQNNLNLLHHPKELLLVQLLLIYQKPLILFQLNPSTTRKSFCQFSSPRLTRNLSLSSN